MCSDEIKKETVILFQLNKQTQFKTDSKILGSRK